MPTDTVALNGTFQRISIICICMVSPSEEANQRLYDFVRSTVGGTPERKGFAAFVLKMKVFISQVGLERRRH